MKIIISPDKFKGSLSAALVADTIKRAVLSIVPEAEVITIPLADGGEGTVEALVSATGGKNIEKRVSGPDGRLIVAVYGILGEGADAKTAIIEMAAASGLVLLPDKERNPLHTTTYGVGELILDALGRGCRRIIVGLGGSATNDGGSGMAQALGVRFFDEDRREITDKMTGGLLGRVAAVDLTGLDDRLHECRMTIAGDVSNPLLGSDGASQTYAAQKGADEKAIQSLEEGMTHFYTIVEKAIGRSVCRIPGAGAAGGLGAGLLAFCDAEIRPGVDIIMETCRFRDKIRDADLILTGEGKIDKTTFQGKTIAGVLRVAQAKKVPVIAIAGAIAPEKIDLSAPHIPPMFSICPGPASLTYALKHAEALLYDAARQIVKAFMISRG